MNIRLVSIVYTIVSVVLVSVFVIATVMLGYEDMPSVLLAVAVAWVISLPISVVITQRIVVFGQQANTSREEKKGT